MQSLGLNRLVLFDYYQDYTLGNYSQLYFSIIKIISSESPSSSYKYLSTISLSITYITFFSIFLNLKVAKCSELGSVFGKKKWDQKERKELVKYLAHKFTFPLTCTPFLCV